MMQTLIFQVHIKQWDKSQRSETDIKARSQIAKTYPIENKPEFSILKCACIIDRKGDAFIKNESKEARVLKTLMLKNGSVQFENAIVDKEFNLSISNKKSVNLKQGWVQIIYTDRKRVNQNDQIFWLYEEIVINVALVDEVNKLLFVGSKPQAVLEVDGS